MMLLDYVKMTLSNFNKRKFRTFINIFAVSVGVMLIVTMVSLGSGVQNHFMNKLKEFNNIKHVTVYNTAFQTSDELEQKLNITNDTGNIDVKNIFEPKALTSDIVEEIITDKNVEDYILKYQESMNELSFEDKKIKDITIAYYDGDTYLESEKESLIEANSKLDIQIPLEYLVAGTTLTTSSENSVLIPENIVRTTFETSDVETILGKEITLKSIVHEGDKEKALEKKATIVGIIDQRFYQPSILVSKDIITDVKNFELNENKTLEERGVDCIELSVASVQQLPNFIEYIEQDLGYTTDNVQSVADMANKVLFGLKVALSLVGIIVICIASLDVVNTMIMSIYERTKSIGIMKATGASKTDIRNLFLVEGGVIGFIGGIIGTLLSFISLKILRVIASSILLNLEFSDVSFLSTVITIDFKVAFFTILFATTLTLIAGLYPSIKASKLNPINALRHD